MIPDPAALGRDRAAPEPEAATVLIVAASAVERAGLERLLAANPGIRVVGSARDPLEARELARRLAPEVLLVAGSALLPRGPDSGFGGAAGIGVVLLDREAAAAHRGLNAVLPPDAASREIIGAVYAAAGGLFVSPAPRGGGAARARPETALTAREVQVLRMMAEGLPNKTIASDLGITSHTVKFHIASILSKLGASSRTEAVTLGLRRGLILL